MVTGEGRPLIHWTYNPAWEKWPFRLDLAYTIVLPPPGIERCVGNDYLTISNMGWLMIRKGYRWDGPSGPAINTPTFMRASLVHDALYQLIREGYLPYSYRKVADNVMHQIARQDGMNKWRAWYAWTAVRCFGWTALVS